MADLHTPSYSDQPLLRSFESRADAFQFPHGLVKKLAFYPSTGDTDGISLFYESLDDGLDGYTTPETLLAASRSHNKREYGGIVSITSRVIYTLNLSLLETPSEQFVGHCIIPQLSRTLYDASRQSKQAVQSLAFQLADLAIIRIVPKPILKSPPSVSE